MALFRPNQSCLVTQCFTDTNMGMCADPGQKQGSLKLQGSASVMERAIKNGVVHVIRAGPAPGRSWPCRLFRGGSGCERGSYALSSRDRAGRVGRRFVPAGNEACCLRG